MPLWKWLLLLIVGCILFYFLYGVANITATASDSPAVGTLLCICASAAMLALYAGLSSLIEKRKIDELRLRSLPAHLGTGFAAGAAIFSISALILALYGCFKIISVGCNAMQLVYALSYMLVIATCEEIIFRGILFRLIDARFGIWAALCVSALIFGFMHIMNPGATILSSIYIAIEAGILLGAAYKYTGTLWFPIGIHWAWNFFEGNIFGFPVSGRPFDISLIRSQTDGPELLTGGSFGPEASLIIPLVCLSLAVFLLYRHLHRSA